MSARRQELLARVLALIVGVGVWSGCDTSVDLEGALCNPAGAPCPAPLITSVGLEDGGTVCRCIAEDHAVCGNGRVEAVVEGCDVGATGSAECTGCQRHPTDAGTADAGSSDAGVVDGGPGMTDAGAADAGAIDAGVVDAGALDAGALDAGPRDAGVDAGAPGPVCGDGALGPGENCDDGNLVDGDGCDTTCDFTLSSTVEGCSGMNLPRPDAGLCEVTLGTNGQDVLLTGTILAPTKTYVGGQLLVRNGGITCVGCYCQSSLGGSAATRLVCPGVVVSPGLINAHEHLGFAGGPYNLGGDRYEHRHDWRKGQNGHLQLTSLVTSELDARLAELRHLLSGTTSVMGSKTTGAGVAGLLRNLDGVPGSAVLLGADGGQDQVRVETFPFGDTAGLQLDAGCGYPNTPAVPAGGRYHAHVAEGIATSAYNEARCFPAAALGSRTSIVQGVGVNAAIVRQWADAGTSLVWSPRSNVALYGDTASIPLMAAYGVRVALATDWISTGSMNLLRELRCADFLNQNRFGRVSSDVDLWRMVTSTPADLTGFLELGRLRPGGLADLALYRGRPEGPHRSVLLANPADVVAVFRGGKVLYGDAALVAAMPGTATCEVLDVCGTPKRACLVDEQLPPVGGLQDGGTTYTELAGYFSGYSLFACGNPGGEPSCSPSRLFNTRDGSNLYPLTDGGIDQDRDGIGDSTDVCVPIFNPVRPLDNGAQADLDRDGLGDVCDPCPHADGGSCP